MKIFYIRHGKPRVIDNNFYQSRLSSEGIRQVKQFALSGLLPRPDLVFSSPYNRAVDTAKAITETFQISFKIKDFLKEWNLQSLNLLDPEYTIETNRGWTDWKLRVKGDESLEEVKERAYKGTMPIISKNKNANTIYFVSHGTVIDMLCSSVSGRQAIPSDIENMKFLDYAIFEYRNESLSLIKDIIT